MPEGGIGPASESPTPVEISAGQFALTKEEFVPAFRFVLRRQKIYKRWPLVTCGLLLVGVVCGLLLLLLSRVVGIVYLGLVGLMLFTLLLGEVAKYWTPSRVWDSDPLFHQNKVIRLAQEGVDVTGEKSRTFMTWSSIGQVETLGDLYVVTNETGRYVMAFPRRAFSSENDELAFRSLSSRSVSTSHGPTLEFTQHS